jgi:hypothetical protein
MQADNSTFNSAGRDQYNSDGQLWRFSTVQVTGDRSPVTRLGVTLHFSNLDC